MNQLYCLQGAAKHQNGDFLRMTGVREVGGDGFTHDSTIAQSYKKSGGNAQICLDEGEQDLLC